MPRPLDHPVLASHDLAAQAQFYLRLGFQVSLRNRHPWGTENHIVQLPNAFLELIGLGAEFAPPASEAASAPFAGFLAQYLAKREGLAMLALRSADAASDAAAFAALGVGVGAPFHFERRGKRMDGGETHVAFTLAFAGSKLIDEAGFFACQHHHPENFWNAASQVHPNTAQRLISVVMVAENPSAHAEFLSHFTGEREMLATSMGVEIDTGDGRIEVLTPLAYQFRFGFAPLSDAPHFAAIRIAIAHMPSVIDCLTGEQIAFARHGALAVVPPQSAYGVAIVFEPDAT